MITKKDFELILTAYGPINFHNTQKAADYLNGVIARRLREKEGVDFFAAALVGSQEEVTNPKLYAIIATIARAITDIQKIRATPLPTASEVTPTTKEESQFESRFCSDCMYTYSATVPCKCGRLLKVIG